MATEALTDHRIDCEALAEEIGRYLAVVDVFRGAGCEPVWQAESSERGLGPSEGR